MKTLLALLCVVVLFCLGLCAPAATLAWDANPPADKVIEYLVYQLTGTTRTFVGRTAGTSFDLPQPIPTGVTLTYTVTAFNGHESEPAEPVVISATKPTRPARLRITITVPAK